MPNRNTVYFSGSFVNPNAYLDDDTTLYPFPPIEFVPPAKKGAFL